MDDLVDLPHCVVKHKDDLQSITSWCSFVSIVLALACFSVRLLDRSTRPFPARTATMTAFVALLFSCNIFMGYTMGYRQMDPLIRYTHPHKADMYDRYCKTQGTIFQFTAVLMIGMVLFISLLTYQIVVMRRQAWQIAHLEERFLLGIFMSATLATFLPVIVSVDRFGVYGQSSGTMSCWFNDTSDQLAYFYWYMFVVVGVVSFMAFRILCRFWMLVRSEFIMSQIIETNSGNLGVAHDSDPSATEASSSATSGGGAHGTPRSTSSYPSPAHSGLRVSTGESDASHIDGVGHSISTVGRRSSAASVAQTRIEQLQGSLAFANYSFFTHQLTRAMLYQMMRHFLFVLLFDFTFITVILDFFNRLCEEHKDEDSWSWKTCNDGWAMPCDTTYLSTVSTSLIGVFVAVAFLRYPKELLCCMPAGRGPLRFLSLNSEDQDTASEVSTLQDMGTDQSTSTSTTRNGRVHSLGPSARTTSDGFSYSKLSDGDVTLASC